MKLNAKLLALSFILFFACSPSRFVKPLEKGQQAIGGTLGGPLIHFAGTVIPVPFTTLYYGYGLSNRATVFGGLHTTSLAFNNLQTDLGLLLAICKPKDLVPGLSVAPSANLILGMRENQFKIWPQLDVNAYWEYGSRKHLIYVGISNWFELANKRAHNEPQPNHWIFNPQIGHTYNTANQKWAVNLELKYLAPTYSNQNLVVDYLKPTGNKGSAGIYFGITRKF